MRRKTAYQLTRNRLSGFTLIEVLITLVIIAIAAAFSAPAILSMAPGMALKSAAQDLYTTISDAKIMAIKENRDITVIFTPGFYYIDANDDVLYTPGEQRVFFDEDSNRNGAFDAGEDANGNGRWDTKYGIGLGTATAPSDWNGNPIVQAPSITFNSRGTLLNPASVYIDSVNPNLLNFCYAATVRVAGGVKLRKFNGAQWEQ